MRYKIGDRVRINISGKDFKEEVLKLNGELARIVGVDYYDNSYKIDRDEKRWWWHESELISIKEEEDVVKTYHIDELVEDVEYKSKSHSNLKFKKWENKLMQSSKLEQYIESNISYNKVLKMEFIECEFEPKYGCEYFYPCFRLSNGCDYDYWYDDTIDKDIKRRVGVYRTQKQAQEKARELGWID